ncbi:MAG: threonine--tRNA ligase [Candidatus Methylomirabilales bacterium]
MKTGQVEVILPDGRAQQFQAGLALSELLPQLDADLEGRVVAARLDGRPVDLSTAPSPGAKVELVPVDSPDGLYVLRHSTAHLMAAAVQELYPEAKFAIGPPVEDGFYYDIDLPGPLTAEELPTIEAKMRALQAQRLPYVRVEMSVEEALRLMEARGQTFKVEILETIRRYGTARPDAVEELQGEAEAGGVVSFYQTGSFLDLCRGPHVPDTSFLRAFKLTHIAGAYWRGDERNPMLTRIYGTAFPTEGELEQHLYRLEEARRRDHRRLGRELDLFSFEEAIGPGLVLWHPKGALIREVVEAFWRTEHRRRGYQLVYTPHVARAHLWEVSGHLSWYRDNMFSGMEVEGQEYLVKPMNCPFHILIYRSRTRSYRDLPLRVGEMGTVYRYERSGVLHGLLRVRGFTQDDAHIFCRPDQLESEVADVLELALAMLRAFGFTEHRLMLSVSDPNHMTRYAGSPEEWQKVEAALEAVLQRSGMAFIRMKGEAAFYGPKIDVSLVDVLGRQWQCATIQVDFNMPERFDLGYIGEDGKAHRPLMVHRALLGSLERFFGILIEHHAGAFPLWLAPVQVAIIPLTDRHHSYAQQIAERLAAAGVRVEIDDRNEKVGYKIRQAEVSKVPYIVVVGDREVEKGLVSVRERGRRERGAMLLDALLEELRKALHPPMTGPVPWGGEAG